jgi:GNAT superfamily N-acetyltransferase
MNPITLISYQDHHQPAFRALNLEWLDLYNLTESHDLKILDNPRATIIDGGGVIFIAAHEERVVGTAALMKEGEGVFELVKMAVDKDFRKGGISKLLIEKCIEAAKQRNAVKIILFSNHQLKAALGLYEKYGFVYVPVKDSPFLTADIKMELALK